MGNRPIVIGNMKFVNLGALRGRVREILNSRSEGEFLKAEGADFKLVVELLKYHPQHEKKAKDLKGVKVAKSEKGDNRCFWVTHDDGTAEDFSMKKCLDALELNPPYEAEKPKPVAKAEPKKESKPAQADPAKPGEPQKEETKTESKSEEPKTESKAEVKSEDTPKSEEKKDGEPPKEQAAQKDA